MSRYLYMYVKPLNKGFIIPLISFSSLLVSNFLKRCMVSSEYPTLHVWCAWKKKTRENKPLKFSWWPEKNHCGLKNSLLKNTCLIIGKKNQRPYASLLSLFLPCSTMYNQDIFSVFHCSYKAKWHNSEKELKIFDEDEVNIIHWSFLRLQQIIFSVLSLRCCEFCE